MGRWWSRGSEGFERTTKTVLSSMAIMRIQIAGLCLLVVATFARCQLVQTGPPDPHSCEMEEVAPNLILPQDGKISGRVIDQTGAPFRDSPVELRVYLTPIKQVPVAKVMTNRDGQFSFERVNAGKYRILASPTRAFQQSDEIRCNGSECDLILTLRVNPTDTPYSQCPVR
jgi:Carboxypeptidase regulatory-like domain